MMKIDIAVFDGMDELDAVGPFEVLRRAEVEVKLVTRELTATVRCANGLQLVPDGVARDDAEIMIFPGGGWNARSEVGVRAEVESKRWAPVIGITAGGVTSGIDLGLRLVERFAGAQHADRIARALEYPRERAAC